MISIIICSKQADITPEFKENIKTTIGVDYELVVVDNSKGEHSIFAAYNKGFRESNYPYLCFVHEDVLFQQKDWGAALIAHLSNAKTGIVGVAGGPIATRIPASWWLVGKGYKNLIQHYKVKNTIANEISFTQAQAPKEVIVLDGVFLSFRRDLFDSICFDETLTGFHGYDHDICIQSVVAGYKNYVVFDILLTHFSEGSMNAQYYTNLLKVYKKWADNLPLSASDVPDKILNNFNKLENKLFNKLIRRLIKVGFSKKLIESDLIFFNQIISKNSNFYVCFLLKIKIHVYSIFK